MNRPVNKLPVVLRSRNAVLKYWQDILQDRKSSQSRRDQAAQQLAMVVHQINKLKFEQKKLKEKIERDRLDRKTRKENLKYQDTILKQARKNRADEAKFGKHGRKREKREAAQAAVTTSKWGKLLPKSARLPKAATSLRVKETV